MATRHQKLVAKIFSSPTRSDITYSEMCGLVEHHGGEVQKRAGSRRCIELNGVKMSMHEPHPDKELRKYQVEDLREFLERVGITPDLGTIPDGE